MNKSRVPERRQHHRSGTLVATFGLILHIVVSVVDFGKVNSGLVIIIVGLACRL